MDASLLILYGSQTGNAQDVAERLAREAKVMLFKPRVLAMDSYDVTQLPKENLIIFVTATTGQGDPPDNMRAFWRFLLRKSLAANSLAETNYAVFGLGDSSYPQFNVVAKKLDKRLQALGGRQICAAGLGDDQHASGYEAALDTWAAELWPKLRQLAGPLPPGIPQPVVSPSTVLALGDPKYQMTVLDPLSSSQTATAGQHSSTAPQAGMQTSWQQAVAAGIAFRRVVAAASAGILHDTNSYISTNSVAPSTSSGVQGSGAVPHGPHNPYFAPLLVNERITSQSHFQDTRHMELDIEGSGMTYEPGDVLAIIPQQPAAAIDATLARLGFDGQQLVSISPSLGSAGGPAASAVKCVTSIRSLFEGALDISSASPRRYFFQVLSHFAKSDMERERLQYFASAEGRDDLYSYCHREARNVLEVLQDFPSCQLPLEWLLESCPPLLPRKFSISSSLRLHPGRIQLTVAIVDYKTPYGRKKRGLCSSYLARLQPVHHHNTKPGEDVSMTSPQGHSSATTHLQDATNSITGNPSSSAIKAVNTATENGRSTAAIDDESGDADRVAGHQLAIWIEKGSLHMPKDLAVPLILIGPGTGVAPLRSMVQERLAIKQQQSTPGSQDLSACHLFFGCRSASADYYYEQEWLLMQQQGVLAAPPTGLVTAFSRDGAGSKVYVQHRLREHGAHMWSLLQAGGVVYVSGSAKQMPSDVAIAWQDIAQQHGGLSKEDAAKFVRHLQLTGRYFVEAWS